MYWAESWLESPLCILPSPFFETKNKNNKIQQSWETGNSTSGSAKVALWLEEEEPWAGPGPSAVILNFKEILGLKKTIIFILWKTTCSQLQGLKSFL